MLTLFQPSRFRSQLLLTFFYTICLIPYPQEVRPQVLIICFFICTLSVCFNLFKIEFRLLSIGRFISVALASLYIYWVFGTFRGLDSGLNFLYLLGAFKTFDIRTRKDRNLIILIMQLVLVSKYLLLESFSLVLYSYVVNFLLFSNLSQINFQEEIRFDKEVFKLSFKIFSFSIPVVIVLFFLFPRVEVGILPDLSMDSHGKTGFTQKLEPGSIEKILKDDSSIFKAYFNEKLPKKSQLYWRGAVLKESDGINWKVGRKNFQKKKGIDEKYRYVYNISFENGGNSALFNLKGLTSLKMKTKGHLRRLPGEAFKYTSLSKRPLKYQAKVSGKIQALNHDNYADYLKTPEKISPEVRRLISRLNAKTIKVKVKNIQNFLLSDFNYTLSPGTYSDENFLDEFLLKRKTGFCEHFASAFANLFRLLNIPSRVIVGFQGGEFNQYANTYNVRAQDAHAWLEYWDERKKEWIRFDPTEYIHPMRIERGSETYQLANNSERSFIENIIGSFLGSESLKKIKMMYLNVNFKFINFDKETQASFYKSLWPKNVWPFIWISLSLIFTGSLFYYYFMNPISWSEKIDRYYLSFLKKWKKKGARFERSMGPKEIFEINKAIDHNGKASQITEIYCQLRYAENWELFDEFKKNVRHF